MLCVIKFIKKLLIQIAIPKHTSVSCLAWNQQSGYIAVGGDDGMLKVLKLESGKNLARILHSISVVFLIRNTWFIIYYQSSNHQIGGGGNLSMNLSLEGHSGQLQVATWNEIHQKLTTSDQHGVIIVWMLYKVKPI